MTPPGPDEPDLRETSQCTRPVDASPMFGQPQWVCGDSEHRHAPGTRIVPAPPPPPDVLAQLRRLEGSVRTLERRAASSSSAFVLLPRDDGAGYQVALGDADLTAVVGGVELGLWAGHGGPRASVTLHLHPGVAVHAGVEDSKIRIDADTAALLERLGWTPPKVAPGEPL